MNIKEQLKTLRDKIKKHSDIKGNKIRFTKRRQRKSKHRLAATVERLRKTQKRLKYSIVSVLKSF